MKTRLAFVAIILFLTAVCGCAGDYAPPGLTPEAARVFTISFTYPVDQMAEFPVTGSLIVHFTADLHPDIGPSLVTLERLEPNNAVVPVAVDLFVNDGNIVVKPKRELLPLRLYRLTVSPGVRGVDGAVPELPADGYAFEFTTLGDRPLAGRPLKVTSVFPDPDRDPVFDFHTFRVYFTEPLDRRTVALDDTIRLTNEAGDRLPGTVFVRAAQLVFDPIDDLEPGRHTLTLTTGIKDVGGEGLDRERQFVFDVLDSGEHTMTTMENCPTLGSHSSCEALAAASDLPRHAFTGDDTNSMLVNSLLLGPTRAYVSGQLKAELGDTSENSEAVPLVIRKGQRLHLTSIESHLGGEISTGLVTGDVTVHILTDAVGLVHASNLTTALDDGPVGVSLVLDAAITPADQAASMIMSQNILGTRLHGMASVNTETGKLVLAVAGYAEFFILGERIPTTMSLVMQDTTEVAAETEAQDQHPPELRMTSPPPNARGVRLGTAIHLVFDEPVTTESAAHVVSLRTETGQTVAADLLNNGPRLLLVPREPLAPDSAYQLWIDPGLSDVSGNATTNVLTRTFTTGAVEWSAEPPIVVTTSPGAGHAPALVPGHLPIEVWFSQVMDPDTIVLGDTFRVLDRTTGRDVRGTLVTFFDRLAFYPNEALEPGHSYRVVLTPDITSYGGVRLDIDRNHTAGGALGATRNVIDFVAGGANDWVPLRLALSPAVDVDGSGFVDNTETVPDEPVNFLNFRNPLIPELSHATGSMVSYIKGLDYDDEGVAFLDIEMIQGISLTTTSTQLDLSVLWDLFDPATAASLGKAGFFDIFEPTGRIIIDVPTPGSAPAFESPLGLTQMALAMTPALSIDNQTLESSAVTGPLKGIGDLSFSDDGLMVVDFNGNVVIQFNLEIPLVGITLPVPIQTQMNMRAVSRNPLAWWNTF